MAIINEFEDDQYLSGHELKLFREKRAVTNVGSGGYEVLTDTTFSMVLIEDNIIVTSPACTGVLVNGATAATYLEDLTIGGNLFYLRNGATGIALASCAAQSCAYARRARVYIQARQP